MIDYNYVSNIEEPFNPEAIIIQMLELSNKALKLLHSNAKEALKKVIEINNEVTRLVKLIKDYDVEQMAEFKKNQLNQFIAATSHQ